MILVTPDTVVRWHGAGFRLYWSWISRAGHAVGRKPISREVRELIFRMVAENPTWGAPQIHGELNRLTGPPCSIVTPGLVLLAAKRMWIRRQVQSGKRSTSEKNLTTRRCPI